MSVYPLYHDADSGSASSFTHGRSASTALGRPNLTNWELFVRESLQNSWDARDRSSADDGVTFAIDYRLLDDHSSDILRRRVFGRGTAHVPGLKSALAKSNIPLLIVSDSGTTGLRGPTNAAIATKGPSDFNSFVREIGRSATKAVKGGSYGFGKGVFFTAGRSRTILVYTRTTDEMGERVHRFIAVANDDSYEFEGFKYTGRHWWGVQQQFEDPRTGNTSVFAEPMTGPQADNAARFFKMDRHFTEKKQTGTSIAVIDPAFEDSSEEQMSQIASALTRWAWPHMVHTPDGEDELNFEVTHNELPLTVPDPRADPVLKEFVTAYLDSLSVNPSGPEGFEFRRSTEVSPVRSGRPVHGLGRLGIREIRTKTADDNSVLEHATGSIALMRGPRMVVEYRNGPADRFGRDYAAVFTAADDLDREFALSEPTTHDAWHPRTLTDRDLTGSTWKSRNNPVKIALDHMDELIRSWGTDGAGEKDSPYDSASRQIASMLGGVLGSIPGTSMSVKKDNSARKGSTTAKPRRRKGSPQARLVNLLPDGAELYAVFQLTMDLPPEAQPTVFEVSVQVETDSGPTRNWEDLGYRPVIESWRFTDSDNRTEDLRPSRHAAGSGDSDTVTFTPEHANAVIFVRQQRGLAVSLKITQIQTDVVED
ncbi:MAG: hypothetical protein LKG15_03150 [Corynebacterium provencense]|uniref:hypothetical protein n=1 Tax=Corynebacterium provencense TaxID=1737425 RepID=UPI002989A78A|nr:hypothetical protein [Corynebacterium provencense]